MCQQFFSDSEKLKIVCTTSVLFIALQSTPYLNTHLGRFSIHLCYTEIFSSNWICLYYWSFLIGSDCVNSVERGCFVLSYVFTWGVRARAESRGGFGYVCVRVLQMPLATKQCRGTLTCFHTGPALSSLHKDDTVPLLLQQTGWDGHRMTPLWQVVLLFYLVQQWDEMYMENSAGDVLFSYANILNNTNRHWSLGLEGAKI